jgi:hypothetical protein
VAEVAAQQHREGGGERQRGGDQVPRPQPDRWHHPGLTGTHVRIPKAAEGALGGGEVGPVRHDRPATIGIGEDVREAGQPGATPGQHDGGQVAVGVDVRRAEHVGDRGGQRGL